MPGVLKRYDAATGTWVPTVGAPQAQPGLLAIKHHRAGADGNTYSITSNTSTDVDATNLKVTFVVPASGQVTVRLKAMSLVTTATDHWWGVHDGTTLLSESLTTGTTTPTNADVTLLLTGLTPGTTKTLTWRWRVSGVTARIYTGPTYGPAVMEVWDAQTGAGVMVPAQPPLLHVRDEKAAATDAGAAVVGWQTRVLNTVVTNDIPGASLAANEISLPAGTYEVEASAPAFAVNRHRARLYNVTGAVTLAWGTTQYTAGSGTAVTTSAVRGRFTLAATSTVRLEHHAQTAKTDNGLGASNAGNDGGTEVYVDLMIRKVG